MRRQLSQRILCSLEELKTMGEGKAIKFALNPTETPKESNRRHSSGTGFVFYCSETKKPRAFKNLYVKLHLIYKI